MSLVRNLALATPLLAGALSAQTVDPELAVNNFFRVRSTAAHATTGTWYPYSPTCPPGYAASTGPGVVAGTRLWTYTPPLRTQMGGYGPNFMTVTGITQAIYVGAAVATWPAPNHYQFRTGIGPAQLTGNSPYQKQHAASGPDLFSIADAPTVIQPATLITEISTTLTTPIPVPNSVDLLLYLQYRGGEYWDDPNGGQTAGCDYQGGRGPGGLAYCGWTIPAGVNAYTVTINNGGYNYRPKIGLLIKEPVFTATGHHANAYYQPLLVGEYYRSIAACLAPWSTNVLSDVFFDVRAGSNYGSNGAAVAFLNLGAQWWPLSVPIDVFGNFLLNPTDPLLSALASTAMPLLANGEFFGETSAIKLAPFGPSAVGLILKTQAVVFNPGLTNIALTNSSSILIE
jgi:hypothetical protein